MSEPKPKPQWLARQLGPAPAPRRALQQPQTPPLRVRLAFVFALPLSAAQPPPPGAPQSQSQPQCRAAPPSPLVQPQQESQQVAGAAFYLPFYVSVKEDAEQPKPQQVEEVNALSHLSEEEQMQMLLGFGGFDSTKGKAVEENVKSAAVGTARRENKREYRQYMNRRGGFNRPLDKS